MWDFIGGQKRLVDKLQKLDVSSMPSNQQIAEINTRYNLELGENNGKLDITNSKEAKKYINALNEDYVESITGKKFEAHSKELI